jgi:DNA-directed RNA polymerase specialized sigma24 family protein
MEELAQSVGNEKMPGEFDWDAATVVDPNTNDGGSFQHLVDSNPALGREEALSLLSQKIAQLPTGPKKVLAMHYHEHLGLSEIAACIGVTESRICQIHGQTVALLRDYLWRASKPVSTCFSQKSDLVVLHPPRSISAKK